jgi:hypothetical protein
MICKDMTYMFLMDDRGYYLEQYWYFGGPEGYDDANETAVKFFSGEENNGDGSRKLISRLTFDDLCGLKESVDKVFENLLSRYKQGTDDVSYLLQRYPWLKEKANINPLFVLKETDDK